MSVFIQAIHDFPPNLLCIPQRWFYDVSSSVTWDRGIPMHFQVTLSVLKAMKWKCRGFPVFCPFGKSSVIFSGDNRISWFINAATLSSYNCRGLVSTGGDLGLHWFASSSLSLAQADNILASSFPLLKSACSLLSLQSESPCQNLLGKP